MLNNYQGIINIDRTVKKETQNFLIMILERDPTERYSSEEALEDSVFCRIESDLNHEFTNTSFIKTHNEYDFYY